MCVCKKAGGVLIRIEPFISRCAHLILRQDSLFFKCHHQAIHAHDRQRMLVVCGPSARRQK